MSPYMQQLWGSVLVSVVAAIALYPVLSWVWDKVTRAKPPQPDA